VRVTVSMIRFLFEAAFIILIAAATAVAHLGRVWIALSVGAAWLLVSVVERSVIQEDSLLLNGRLRFLFAGRRGQPQSHDIDGMNATSPPTLPASLAAEHPPTPLPEPGPPAPEPAPPAPEPQPPTPEPGEPPPQLRSVPAPEPDPEPEAAPQQPEPVVRLPLDGAEPREWNIWELERLAHESGGRDPVHDEELVFLLLELRQFANADGQLPVDFDPVVRESFGELIYAAV
jgi:hypothetical protein